MSDFIKNKNRLYIKDGKLITDRFKHEEPERVLTMEQFIGERRELPLSMLNPYKDAVIRFYSDMDTASFLKVKTRVNNNIKTFHLQEGLEEMDGAMAYFEPNINDMTIDGKFINYDENDKVKILTSEKQVNEILQHEIHHAAGTSRSLNSTKNFDLETKVGLMTDKGHSYRNIGEGVNDYFAQLSTGSGCLRYKTGYTLYSTLGSILRHSTDLMTLKNAHVNDFSYLKNACKELSGSDHTLGIIEYNLEWERLFANLAYSEADKGNNGLPYSEKLIAKYNDLSDDCYYNVLDEAFFNLLIPKLASVSQNERIDIINGIYSDLDDEEMVSGGLGELLQIISFDKKSFDNAVEVHRSDVFNAGLQAAKSQLMIVDKKGNPVKFSSLAGGYIPITEEGMEDRMFGYIALSQVTKTDLKNFEKSVSKGIDKGEVMLDTDFRSRLNRRGIESAIKQISEKLGYMAGDFTKVKKSTCVVSQLTKIKPQVDIEEEEKMELATYLSEKLNEFNENQSMIRVKEDKEQIKKDRELEEAMNEDYDEGSEIAEEMNASEEDIEKYAKDEDSSEVKLVEVNNVDVDPSEEYEDEIEEEFKSYYDKKTLGGYSADVFDGDDYFEDPEEVFDGDDYNEL